MRPSILETARLAPDHPALIVEGRTLTYGELAARVVERMKRGLEPGPLVVTNSVEAVVDVWAMIEQRAPIGVLHPRLTEHERAPLLARLAAATLPDDALAIFFTSGTSGTPKGAVLSAHAFVAAAEASAKNLGWLDHDRWLLALPIAHVGGFSILTRCALAAKTVILEPSFDAERFLNVLARDRATMVSLVPTMLRRLLARGFEPSPHLRVILLGGAPAPADLLAEARVHGLPVLTTYGLTEACSQVTVEGRPLPGTEVEVVRGRIQIRGPTLFSGYLGEPRRAEGAWFDTGDMGHLDRDGRLVVVGRRSDLILSGGENVHPGEVEAVLLQHPAIRVACVFGVPDPEWGEVVSAALIARGAPVDLAVLEKFLRERLAGHKRPRRICWVDELAENRAGKVDRRAVRELVWPLLRDPSEREP